MAERKTTCTLSERSAQCHENDCGTCGWNRRVIKERNAKIAANGLTQGPDGLHRLIIEKEGETDGSNT